MLEIPAFAASPLWYAGLVAAIFFGWASSSYASNFSYRLPRNETPFGREPYCGDCDHKLHPKDLFPIFSWLFTRGKCRYCEAKVPATYMLFELFYTLYLTACYVAFGFSDMFLVAASLGMALQISVMMAWDDDYIAPIITIFLLALGLIHRILIGETLMDGVLASFLALFAALALIAVMTRQAPNKDVYALPKWVWLLAATGPWVDASNLFLFLALLAGGVVLLKALSQKTLATQITIAQACALVISFWWPIIG